MTDAHPVAITHPMNIRRDVQLDKIPENPQRAKNNPNETKPAEKNDKNQTREQPGKSGGRGDTKHDDKQTSGKS